MHATITTDRLIQAMADDENTGFCLECGAERSQVEPDAENYKCDACGTMAVCGAENIALKLI